MKHSPTLGDYRQSQVWRELYRRFQSRPSANLRYDIAYKQDE